MFYIVNIGGVVLDINISIAKNAQQIRKQKKMTLDAAANATGVSRSMLVQIEKGDVNPTISVLWKIANGYKVSFTSLVESEQEQTAVISAESVIPIEADSGRYVNFPAFTFNNQRLFETYRIVISPQGSLKASPHLAGSEEYITVFEGDAEITVDDEVFRLNKGDSIKFKADIPHGYKNIGESDVQLSMLIYYAK